MKKKETKDKKFCVKVSFDTFTKFNDIKICLGNKPSFVFEKIMNYYYSSSTEEEVLKVITYLIMYDKIKECVTEAIDGSKPSGKFCAIMLCATIESDKIFRKCAKEQHISLNQLLTEAIYAYWAKYCSAKLARKMIEDAQKIKQLIEECG